MFGGKDQSNVYKCILFYDVGHICMHVLIYIVKELFNIVKRIVQATLWRLKMIM